MPYVNKPRDTVSCLVCGTGFERKSNNHVYCCKACKRTAARNTGGAETTERQYALISGNWEKYFGRLCTRAFRRDLLSKQDCIALLEKQGYKCALTGVELTCILEKGTVCKTNASIDRIDPKGPYTKDNVQLVCAAINKLRVDMSVDDFINWCKKVSDHALREQA
jgi:hypothetical protein